MPEEPLERYRTWLESSLCPLVQAWCPDGVRRRYCGAMPTTSI